MNEAYKVITVNSQRYVVLPPGAEGGWPPRKPTSKVTILLLVALLCTAALAVIGFINHADHTAEAKQEESKVEATPVVTTVQETPVAIIPPKVEPPVVAEVAMTWQQELVERFRDVKVPERIWPDPQKFDGVDLPELRKFAGMTVDEFIAWGENHPKQTQGVSTVVVKTFADIAISKQDAQVCAICTSKSPKEFCKSYVDKAALAKVCQESAVYIGDNAKPLENVLQTRLQRLSRKRRIVAEPKPKVEPEQ